MKEVYGTKDYSLAPEIKDIDGKKGVVTGYFSHFNNVDSDGDIILKGAFAKTILENGPDSKQPRIKHLLNHDPSQPLGKLAALKEDDKGLYYESQIAGHDLGRNFVKMVEGGLISEHSIGFRIIKRNQLQDFEGYMKNPDDGWYEITELKLWEGSSLTAWGANPLTPIESLKSDKDQLQKIVNRQKALEKFCRNTDATDDIIELLLLEHKQLTQIIIDLTKEATKPEQSTLPESKGNDEITNFITNLNLQTWILKNSYKNLKTA